MWINIPSKIVAWYELGGSFFDKSWCLFDLPIIVDLVRRTVQYTFFLHLSNFKQVFFFSFYIVWVFLILFVSCLVIDFILLCTWKRENDYTFSIFLNYMIIDLYVFIIRASSKCRYRVSLWKSFWDHNKRMLNIVTLENWSISHWPDESKLLSWKWVCNSNQLGWKSQRWVRTISTDSSIKFKAANEQFYCGLWKM